MTPKKQAEQLIDSYYVLLDGFVTFEQVKQCALIAVDEMLNWFKAHSYSNKNYDAFVFYQEVKQEIEKL